MPLRRISALQIGTGLDQGRDLRTAVRLWDRLRLSSQTVIFLFLTPRHHDRRYHPLLLPRTLCGSEENPGRLRFTASDRFHRAQAHVPNHRRHEVSSAVRLSGPRSGVRPDAACRAGFSLCRFALVAGRPEFLKSGGTALESAARFIERSGSQLDLLVSRLSVTRREH